MLKVFYSELFFFFVFSSKSIYSLTLCLFFVFTDHFLKSLELDPDNMYASILYGMFLMERGHPSHYVDIFFHFTESSVYILFQPSKKKPPLPLPLSKTTHSSLSNPSSPSLQKIPIDPVTCEELGGRIRIYYPPTSSIKTVAIKATTPASEICHSLCKSFNITEDQEVCERRGKERGGRGEDLLREKGISF